jgi:hypothetical protein
MDDTTFLLENHLEDALVRPVPGVEALMVNCWVVVEFPAIRVSGPPLDGGDVHGTKPVDLSTKDAGSVSQIDLGMESDVTTSPGYNAQSDDEETDTGD